MIESFVSTLISLSISTNLFEIVETYLGAELQKLDFFVFFDSYHAMRSCKSREIIRDFNFFRFRRKLIYTRSIVHRIGRGEGLKMQLNKLSGSDFGKTLSKEKTITCNGTAI